MKKKLLLSLSVFLIILVNPSRVFGAEEILPLEEFIKISTQRDTEFEQILIDELPLNYQKDLNLPAKDLVLELKTQYEFYLMQDREDPEGTVSLSKLRNSSSPLTSRFRRVFSPSKISWGTFSLPSILIASSLTMKLLPK